MEILLNPYCLAQHILDAEPKFLFKFKKDVSYELRDYESVDEKSIS